MPELGDYKVKLENYYGPLDLLLHLVKESEVDITRIVLARACEQYIGFLAALEDLDINLSGDFLALASKLLLIKSRALAPPEAPSDEEATQEEGDETSVELIRKLLEYRRFKERARALDLLAAERARRFPRPRLRVEGETEAPPEPVGPLELWDLVLVYSRKARSIRLESGLSILYRDIPLEVFVERILAELRQRPSSTLRRLAGEPLDRSHLVGSFLALLQLAKDQKVTLAQDEAHGDISVQLRPSPAEEPGGIPSPKQSPNGGGSSGPGGVR